MENLQDSIINITVSQEDAGRRIDQLLSDMENLSRSTAQKLCDDGRVTVNGIAVGKKHKVKAGDAVAISIPPPKSLEVIPENIPIDIIYEDEHLIVVDKPRGMVVHPAAGNENGTLVNALLYHCGDSLRGIGGVARPGIVHRIDKDTSGLLVVAKTDAAHQALSAMMKEHSVKRQYQTIVHGRVKEESGVVDAPIGRHPVDRKKMCVTERNSRHAVTHYRVKEELDGFTYLELELETGRTHQIRVHMAYLGHPVAGDSVYGPKRYVKSLDGQCLHAGLLGFIHPIIGDYMEFESPLPEYFTEFLRKNRRK